MNEPSVKLKIGLPETVDGEYEIIRIHNHGVGKKLIVKKL